MPANPPGDVSIAPLPGSLSPNSQPKSPLPSSPKSEPRSRSRSEPRRQGASSGPSLTEQLQDPSAVIGIAEFRDDLSAPDRAQLVVLGITSTTPREFGLIWRELPQQHRIAATAPWNQPNSS